jgi:hypothetical protein
MNDKLIIERYKTAKRDAKLTEPPRLITSEEIAALNAIALAVLAALENKTDAPRSIRPLSNKPKSEAHQELENRLEGILDRWKDAPPTPTLHQTQPGKLCHGASATIVPEPEIPLHQLLKDLMRKATRK